MAINNAKPFIKWAGGKRQLLNRFEEEYPLDLKLGKINTYIEPFLGGGAVFFSLIQNYTFKKIILNDVNKELILTYKVIQRNVDSLISYLEKLEKQFFSVNTQEERKEVYYDFREKFNISKIVTNLDDINEDSILHAAYFIALNRTCFNGLYRENKKGYFNVPFGMYKNPKILDESNLKKVSLALKGVTLVSMDFEDLEQYVDDNTFIYFDPPYRPLSKSSSFESYTKNGFGDAGQIRLANFYKFLNDKNCNVKLMLSNSNPQVNDPEDEFFNKLYNDDSIYIEEVMASRSINSNASGRGKVSELLIKNYLK